MTLVRQKNVNFVNLRLIAYTAALLKGIEG